MTHDQWISVCFFLFCLAGIFLVGQSCQSVQVLVDMISSPIHLQEETAKRNWRHHLELEELIPSYGLVQINI